MSTLGLSIAARWQGTCIESNHTLAVVSRFIGGKPLNRILILFAKCRLPFVMVVVVLCLSFGMIPRAKGDTVAVGLVTFDVNTLGTPGSPGLNAFTLTNATGGFSSFPDFPVASDVTFLGATITPNGLGMSAFGDQGPGSSQVLFLDSDIFTSALFQATLNQTLFTLGDGTSFQANSDLLSATLLPSSGTQLTPGVDLVVLTVSGAPVATPVPEPREWLLLAAGFTLLMLATSRRS
jgi:hypothetical protein